MKFLGILAVLLSARLIAAPALSSDGAYELNKRSSVDRKYSTGTKLYDAQQFGVKGTWSFATHGATTATDLPLEDHEGNSVVLPTGAIIRDCLIDVVTQPAPDSVNVALSSSAVGDLKAGAFAASYPVSRIACTPVGTVGTMIKLASEGILKIRLGSETPTAGKINVWVEYVLSE